MRYSNFGLQKFRIETSTPSSTLRLLEDSTYVFTVPKHADLLVDTYIVIDLPDIYSPIHNPGTDTDNQWVAYDFRWIQDIGCQIIRDIEFTCGSLLIQKYSGAYISAMVNRDFTLEKKKLFHEMTGNIDEINNPANAFGRNNAYPSSYYTEYLLGAEPSIRGRTLYIPVNAWYSLNTRCAFPIKALKNHDLQIKITFRPIYQLFQVRDIRDKKHKYPYIQPDMTSELFQMYRFLQTPPAINIDTLSNSYKKKQQTWNINVHLISTFCFLSKEESKQFISQPHTYLFKEISEHHTYGIVGTNKIRLQTSKGIVSNWMFFLQRNDVALRNEWNNYSNWPYSWLPSNIIYAPADITDNVLRSGPGININGNTRKNTGFFISGNRKHANQKDILSSMGILFDGASRENNMHSGIFNYTEKYTKTSGSTKHGLYCYHFGLGANSTEYQPSGAINLSYFQRIELDIVTFQPEIDTSITVPFTVQCDNTGNPITVSRKNCWELFEYHYNMTLFEEVFNTMTISNGNIMLGYTVI